MRDKDQSNPVARADGSQRLLDYFSEKWGDIPRCIDWESFCSRLNSHPHEAAQRDSHGRYPLHRVVSAASSPASLDVVHRVVNAYPRALTKRNKSKMTVLHCAASNSKIGAGVVGFLLQNYRVAAFVRAQNGGVPLHYARSEDAVRELIEAFPQSIQPYLHPNCPFSTNDGLGRNALTSVVRLNIQPGLSLGTVRAIFDARPQAIKEIDKTGGTALHWAAQNPYIAVDVVKFIIEEFPRAASIRDYNGRLPIHLACKGSSVRAIAEAYPEGLSQYNGPIGPMPAYHSDGCIPLLYAIVLNKSDEVVEALIEEGWKYEVGGPQGGGGVFLKRNSSIPNPNPNASHNAISSTISRYNPCACKGRTCHMYKIAERYLNRLVMITQSAYSAISGYQQLRQDPILCCLVGIGCKKIDLILWILSVSPSAAKERDGRGRTPLHAAAARADAEPNIIRMLVESEFGKEAARMADNDGRLPLHLAAESGLGYNEVCLIVEAERRALATMDKSTHMYPFALAAATTDSSIDVVYSLLREVPDKLHHQITLQSSLP